MSEFLAALGIVAPYYDLALTLVSFYLFIKMFATKRPKGAGRVYLLPWYLIFAGNSAHILEEGLTVLRHYVWIPFLPQHINGFFELAIISLFIYAILLQKEYVKNRRAKARACS